MEYKFASIKNALVYTFASTQYPIIKCHDAIIALKYCGCWIRTVAFIQIMGKEWFRGDNNFRFHV